MIITTKATKSKSKKQFQHGVRIGFLQHYPFRMMSMGTSLVVRWLRVHLLMQGHRFVPRSIKIPYTAGQRSLCISTMEPVL